MHVCNKHPTPCSAWSPGSGITFHVPSTAQKQIEERENHKCRKLGCSTWVLSKGLVLSAGLELRTGCGSGDHAEGMEGGWGMSSDSPCCALWLEKVPSASIRDPWLSLDCCQETSAVLKLEHRQDAECSQWICREKRWLLRSLIFPVASFKSVSLFTELKLCRASLARCAERVWGYKHGPWFSHGGEPAQNNSPGLQVQLQTVGPVEKFR